jgi:hypothetical protein
MGARIAGCFPITCLESSSNFKVLYTHTHTHTGMEKLFTPRELNQENIIAEGVGIGSQWF